MSLTDTRPLTHPDLAPDAVTRIVLEPATRPTDPPPGPHSPRPGLWLARPLRSAAWLALALCATATLIPQLTAGTTPVGHTTISAAPAAPVLLNL